MVIQKKPPVWPFRFAAHLGVRSPDTPLFQHSVGSADPMAQIRYVAGLGFAGVSDNGLMARPTADQSRIGSTLAEHGLVLSSFVCGSRAMEWPCWGRRDRDSRARMRGELEAAVAAARRSGGRTISLVSGSDDDLPREAQLDAMAMNLRELIDVVADQGLTLALEHVSTRRVTGLLLQRLDDTLRIVEAVGHPALRLVFDTHHVTAMDGDLIAAWRRARDRVAVLQLADYPERHEPGSGEIDFPSFLAALHETNYAGLVELECNTPSQPGIAGEQRILESLRSICASIR